MILDGWENLNFGDVFLTIGLKISYMMKMTEWYSNRIKGIGFSENKFRWRFPVLTKELK